MRRFLFPLLVLAVAGVLLMLDEGSADRGSPVPSPSLEREDARGEPAPAAPGSGPIAGHGARVPVLAPLVEAEEAESGPPLLTLVFSADPPERLRELSCQLRLDGTWANPDPEPVPLGADARVEARVRPGQVVVELVDGRQHYEVDRFQMPEADFERRVEIGRLSIAHGRVLLEGKPVAAKVQVFGRDDSGDEELLVEAYAGASGDWQAGLLRRLPVSIVVHPRVDGFRQPFGPYPLEDEVESVVELPVCWLDLRVEPPGWFGLLSLRRSGDGPGGERWLEVQRLKPEESGLDDGLERFRIGPGYFSLMPLEAERQTFLRKSRIEAGETRRVLLEPLPSGTLHFALEGEILECSPAWTEVSSMSGTGLWSYSMPGERDAGTGKEDWYNLTAGKWTVALRGPLRLAGTDPPEYRGLETDSWSLSFAMRDGDELRLVLGWDEAGKAVWRLEGRD